MIAVETRRHKKGKKISNTKWPQAQQQLNSNAQSSPLGEEYDRLLKQQHRSSNPQEQKQQHNSAARPGATKTAQHNLQYATRLRQTTASRARIIATSSSTPHLHTAALPPPRPPTAHRSARLRCRRPRPPPSRPASYRADPAYRLRPGLPGRPRHPTRPAHDSRVSTLPRLHLFTIYQSKSLRNGARPRTHSPRTRKRRRKRKRKQRHRPKRRPLLNPLIIGKSIHVTFLRGRRPRPKFSSNTPIIIRHATNK